MARYPLHFLLILSMYWRKILTRVVPISTPRQPPLPRDLFKFGGWAGKPEHWIHVKYSQTVQNPMLALKALPMPTRATRRRPQILSKRLHRPGNMHKNHVEITNGHSPKCQRTIAIGVLDDEAADYLRSFTSR